MQPAVRQEALRAVALLVTRAFVAPLSRHLLRPHLFIHSMWRKHRPTKLILLINATSHNSNFGTIEGNATRPLD